MPNPKRLNKQAILNLLILSSFLYVGCAGSVTTHSAAPPAASAVPFESSLDVDLSSSASIGPDAKFTISNQGKDPIVMPSVVLKGNPAFDRSSILFPIQGLKNEEFAIATWKFVIAHSQHFCYAGTPADPQNFAVEPMRLLNGYGFLCCDQSGMILTWLWQGAGYQARLVWMEFHEVPEIFYQGAWHMFDADHHVYYLQLDNQTVASTADVIANPLLVARVADANGNDPAGYSAQFMADQYAVQVPLYLSVDYKVQHTFVLQPGQNLTLNQANVLAAFHGAAEEPYVPPAATGNFDWSLDYSDPRWSSLTQATSRVTTMGNFLTNSGPIGFVVYALSSPFPVTSLLVSGSEELTEPDAAIRAYFSTDGVSSSPAFSLVSDPGSPGQASADLSSVAAGQYSYFVKLEMTGQKAGAARIANVHIVSGFQDSIYLFPNLVPGEVNHLTYQDWSPATADHNVKVSFSQ